MTPTTPGTNTPETENTTEYLTREQRLDAITEIMQTLARRALTNTHEDND